MPPDVQIVVVDDGSTSRPFEIGEVGRPVEVIREEVNRGRAAARNIGLKASSQFDITVFIDSDMLIGGDLIARTVELHSTHAHTTGSLPRIVPSLFATCELAVGAIDPVELLPLVRPEDDWRWSCVYQPSWMGSNSDWEYVGSTYNLISDTDYLKRWKGLVGPWLLPNMVLGGCFSMSTRDALAAGGFDEAFSEYGFTETTLVAKLIAGGAHVVPQVRTAAIHVESNPQHHSQAERNQHFARAHAKFFGEYIRGQV